MPTQRASAPTRPLVVIPAFNEAESISTVLAELSLQPAPLPVLVIDDGSTDGTAAKARSDGVNVVSLPFNVGVGGAMRTGYVYAMRQGFDAVVQVDADGQHEPAAVSELIAGLADADVVVGSRFAGVGDYRVAGPRRWAMRLLAWSLSRLTGTRLTDVTSGFRATGPAALPLFARDYPEEYLGDTVESLVLAHRAGLRVAEVAVSMRPRMAGNPSQSPVRSALYLSRAMLVLMLALVRRRPAPPEPGWVP